MIQLLPIPQYLLESSLCLLVFFFLYKALFQKNTFFQVNRFYLLTGALSSFLIPALHFTWQHQEIEVLAPMVYSSELVIYGFNESLEQTAPLFSLTLGQLILVIYSLGVLFFSVRLLKKLYTLYQITQHNPKEEKEGILTLHTNVQDTSSFFKWLFFNPRHAHEDSHLILEHELVHIRQWHSADVMIMEILAIINWFNPIIHLYNRSLRETHEFIADKFVASLANSTYDYAKLLVNEVSKSINPALSNTFASLIKKRLVMLSTQNSKKRKGLYYLSIIPILMLLIILFSFNLVDPVSGLEELSETVGELIEAPIDLNEKNPSEKVAIRKMTSDTVAPPVPSVFKVVEYMPHFAGCEDIADEKERMKCSDLKIINFLSNNVKYPKAAIKNGTQGTAVIRFVIEEDGSLFFDEEKMEKCMLRDPGNGCGSEALRVMKSMPNWIPGKQDGQPVRVQFTMPIKFKLAEESKAKFPEIPVPPTPPTPPIPPSAAPAPPVPTFPDVVPPPVPPTPPIAPKDLNLDSSSDR
ncbi:MAG: TonB family protein [Maribacter sp.]|jgi:TonB family protein